MLGTMRQSSAGLWVRICIECKRVFKGEMHYVNWFLQFLPKDPTARRTIKRTIWWAVAVILVLQLYFVRELIAAELLFGLGFAIIFLIALAIFALGQAGERGVDFASPYASKMGQLTRQGWSASVRGGQRGIEVAGPYATRAAQVAWRELSALAHAAEGRIRRGVVLVGPYAERMVVACARELGAFARALVNVVKRGMVSARPYAAKLRPAGQRSWAALSRCADRGIEAAAECAYTTAGLMGRGWIALARGADRGIEFVEPHGRKISGVAIDVAGRAILASRRAAGRSVRWASPYTNKFVQRARRGMGSPGNNH